MDYFWYAIYYAFWYRCSDPSLYLLHSPVVAVAVIECLIAIWAAESRVHWLWRWLAIVGAVALMVPARAWEAAWLFGLTLPLIVALLSVSDWWRWRRHEPSSQPQDRPTRFRFSL